MASLTVTDWILIGGFLLLLASLERIREILVGVWRELELMNKTMSRERD